MNLKFLLIVKLSTLEFRFIYFLYSWFLNLQREGKYGSVWKWKTAADTNDNWTFWKVDQVDLNWSLIEASEKLNL